MRECGEAVKSLWIRFVELAGLRAQSTKILNYLTSQVIFIPSFSTTSTHFKFFFTQTIADSFNLFNDILNPSSPTPINKTII